METSATQRAQGAEQTGRIKPILAGGIGNLVEWFDWSAYAFLAPIFAQQFFPSSSPTASLLSTLLVFAVGFFMRPLGAAIIGSYSDRFGRSNALALTIFLMSAGALIIGLTPNAEAIGILAPIMLVFARLLQGFSAGGEFGSSATFMVEYAPPNRRAFVGSFQQVSVVGGTLLASAMAALLTSVLSAEDMASYGWRIPFIIGAVLGVVGLWLRRSIAEPESYAAAKAQGRQVRTPLLEAIKRHPRAMLRVVLVTVAPTVVYYMWIIYLPTFARSTVEASLSDALKANTIALAALLFLLPLGGLLSDWIGRRATMFMAAAGFALLTWPLLTSMTGSFESILFVQLAGIALYALFGANSCAIMVEQFPAEVRTAGVSLPYALAVAVFGGTAPYLSQWLNSQGSGHLFLVYVIAINVIGMIVYLTMPETKDKPLN
ncbi:MFS transporter [Nordella sp. HKS 07]|uniref:MFS transporter n=1 Tax=Nordella sp. HKS 07 TaxID=2712222 RepID=UPI0019D2CB91|nr:MFS transporter [Nordella sp. HKS 07]